MKRSKVVVLDVVGLSPKHFKQPENMPNLSRLSDKGRMANIRPVFPAVTLPVQASLTTGVYPEIHGIVSNGFYFPENFQVSFWEQAAGLVQEERIWERLKRKRQALTTAVLFMQNILYSNCDVIITPKPFHSDEGLIQWCYSKPVGFYEQVCEAVGDFNLMHYWGPMASIESSRWIAGAAVETLARVRPDLMFVYLPHLDYCMQKFGPDDPKILTELHKVDQEVGRIVQGIDDLGMSDETTILVLSEYAFYNVSGAVPINQALREKSLLMVRTINGREYLDFELSPAFAMVDHQIAHVFIKPGHEKKVRNVLEQVDGIDKLLEKEGKTKYRLNHPRSGDLVAVSAKNRWFSYYWWDDPGMEPDFAGHVDIHRKPGYDPMELFLEPGTRRISQDTALIRGSHGYPPATEKDSVPLLFCGEIAERLHLPERPAITDIAGIIESLLLE